MEHMKIKTQCAICPINIWEYTGVKMKKTSEYNEIEVRLNDLSKMKVGVCSKHLKPKKMELDMMTEKNMQGWLEELALGIGDKDWVQNVGSKLKAVSLVGG